MSSRTLDLSGVAKTLQSTSRRIAAGVAAAGLTALAASLPQAAFATDAAAAPVLHQRGDASFTCGGIGLDESTAYRAAMHRHPLSLMLTSQDGSYLADVKIDIAHAGGSKENVLSTDAQGPICLIDLPRGRYTVKATSGGATQERTVMLGGHPQSASFRFAAAKG